MVYLIFAFRHRIKVFISQTVKPNLSSLYKHQLRAQWRRNHGMVSTFNLFDIGWLRLIPGRRESVLITLLNYKYSVRNEQDPFDPRLPYIRDHLRLAVAQEKLRVHDSPRLLLAHDHPQVCLFLRRPLLSSMASLWLQPTVA